MFYLSTDKQQLIADLSGVILSSSVEIRETLKYGRLTFVTDKKCIAFICSKQNTDYIELGFFKAKYLNDPKNCLKEKQRKSGE